MSPALVWQTHFLELQVLNVFSSNSVERLQVTLQNLKQFLKLKVFPVCSFVES